jgi:hypothetical protein
MKLDMYQLLPAKNSIQEPLGRQNFEYTGYKDLYFNELNEYFLPKHGMPMY